MNETRILKEITVWDKVEYNVPNHSYMIDKKTDKCLGYRPTGTKEWQMFSKPRMFSRSYRRFVELKK